MPNHSDQPNNYWQQVRRLFEKLHTSDRAGRDALINELRKLDRPLLLSVLAEMLPDPDDEARCDTAEALLRIDPEAGVPLVLPLLEAPQDFVRWHVCGLLHDFGDERAVEPLTKVILNDPDGDVRHIACYALGKIGASRALPALQWVQQNDRGTDYEGDPVSRMAEEAIESILARQ